MLSQILTALNVCLLIMSSMPAQSAVVFSQAVETSFFGLDANVYVFGSTQRPAESFILPADTTITHVGWFGGYESDDATIAHDFRIHFYEDLGGLPMINHFFEQTVSTAGTATPLTNGSGTVFEYTTSISPLVLPGGTQYWIEILEADFTTSSKWRIAESTPDSTGLTRRFSDSEAWVNDFANSRGALALNLATVPIPAAVWLFGSGLLGLVGRARHKKAA